MVRQAVNPLLSAMQAKKNKYKVNLDIIIPSLITFSLENIMGFQNCCIEHE